MIIGFYGLGEAGSRLAAGLSSVGRTEVRGCDRKVGTASFAENERRCRERGVRLTASACELCAGCDVVLAATVGEYAVETAQGVLPYLGQGQCYVELNSAPPQVKRRIAEMTEQTGACFVDGGIMGAPLRDWQDTEIVLSGERAGEISAALNGCGMNTRCVGDCVGQASSLKLLRSIFMKGLEALLIESLTSAQAMGIAADVFDELTAMMAGEPVRPMFERMVATDVVHAKRRADEIGSMAAVLRERGIDSTMSDAARDKLLWAFRTGAGEHFGRRAPADYHEVVRYFAAIRERQHGDNV